MRRGKNWGWEYSCSNTPFLSIPVQYCILSAQIINNSEAVLRQYSGHNISFGYYTDCLPYLGHYCYNGSGAYHDLSTASGLLHSLRCRGGGREGEVCGARVGVVFSQANQVLLIGIISRNCYAHGD